MKLNQTLRQFIFLSAISLAVAIGTNATQAADTAELTVTASGTGRGTFSPNDNGKKPPTVTITTKAGKGSNSVVLISGTAKGNAGVAFVWCQAGSSGWNLAATSDGYTNWTAYLILSAGTNTIQVYAEDADGNRSLTKTVRLTCNPAGFAPESIAGTTLQLTTSNQSAVLSFGGSSFSQMGSNGVNTGVGTYTYTLINTNTGQLADAFTAPPTTGTNGDVFTLSFTSGTSGTWTNLNTNSGTFTLSDASSTAPVSLAGLTLQGTNAGSNIYQFTNEYGEGTFTSTSTSGNTSGTYTYAQYSPEVAMVTASLTDADDLNTTNYIMMNFSTNSDTYYVETDTTNGAHTSAGTFSVTGETNTEGYTAPASLAGLAGAVTQVKTDGERRSFEISFGASTFGQFNANTNHDSDVGIYTFTRTGAKTGLLLITALAPPDEATNNGTSLVPFTFTGSHSANFFVDNAHGTITFSEAANTAPLSLVGRKLAGSHGGKPGGFSFAYGTFHGIGHDTTSAGTYTYAIYGPQVAMATLNYTDSRDAGTTQYLELWFSSAAGGNYRQDDGKGNVQTGAFTVE